MFALSLLHSRPLDHPIANCRIGYQPPASAPPHFCNLSFLSNRVCGHVRQLNSPSPSRTSASIANHAHHAAVPGSPPHPFPLPLSLVRSFTHPRLATPSPSPPHPPPPPTSPIPRPVAEHSRSSTSYVSSTGNHDCYCCYSCCCASPSAGSAGMAWHGMAWHGMDKRRGTARPTPA
ncbi:hypothetical protein BKA80DRAFT_147759 [Phyllosticta citrichinensis]